MDYIILSYIIQAVLVLVLSWLDVGRMCHSLSGSYLYKLYVAMFRTSILL